MDVREYISAHPVSAYPAESVAYLREELAVGADAGQA
jgi:hypothetical protein